MRTKSVAVGMPTEFAKRRNDRTEEEEKCNRKREQKTTESFSFHFHVDKYVCVCVCAAELTIEPMMRKTIREMAART